MQSAVENASKQYIEISGRDVKITVDASLSDDSYVPSFSTPPHNLPKCLELTHLSSSVVLGELK